VKSEPPKTEAGAAQPNAETGADKTTSPCCTYFKKLADFFQAPVVKFAYHMVR